MKLTPQQFTLIELHESGKWICSTEVEWMRDARKRYSELSKMGYVFEKEKCAQWGHSHNSGLLMRRLVKMPSEGVLSPSQPIERFFTLPSPTGQMEAKNTKVAGSQGSLQVQFSL